MIPVLIDCDPGQDDALALLLALASPELDVLGVTAVAGNQTLEKTTANALRVLELAGRTDIPVAAGADGPVYFGGGKPLTVAEKTPPSEANITLPAPASTNALTSENRVLRFEGRESYAQLPSNIFNDLDEATVERARAARASRSGPQPS